MLNADATCCNFQNYQSNFIYNKKEPDFEVAKCNAQSKYTRDEVPIIRINKLVS